MLPANDLLETLVRTKTAMSRLVAGDPEPYKALWSHEPDVCVMGGFGGYALGWDEVRQNTEMAASRFRGSKSFNVKMITHATDHELAYSVWIEHGEVLVEGRKEHAPLVVRVTHIFRREGNTWKIIHRHGDTVTEKTEASAILQR
jgi:hypothetical protein